MNIFKKNESKNENRLPMPDKVKRGFRYYCSLVGGAGPDGLLFHDGLCRRRGR